MPLAAGAVLLGGRSDCGTVFAQPTARQYPRGIVVIVDDLFGRLTPALVVVDERLPLLVVGMKGGYQCQGRSFRSRGSLEPLTPGT